MKHIHDAVATVAPIISVRENEDGTYSVVYEPEATAEQRAAGDTIAANPPSEPDWKVFRASIVANSAFQTKVMANPLYVELSQVMWKVSEDISYMSEVVSLWNAIAPVFTAEERITLNAISTANNVPLTIADDNTLSLS